jgi:hypothetical protein
MKLLVNMRLLAQSDLMALDEQQHTHNFAEWLIQLGDGALNKGTHDETGMPTMLLPDGTFLFIMSFNSLLLRTLFMLGKYVSHSTHR